MTRKKRSSSRCWRLIFALPNGRLLALHVLHGSSFGVSNRSRFVRLLILITLHTIHWRMVANSSFLTCSLPQSSSRDATVVLVSFGNGPSPFLAQSWCLMDYGGSPPPLEPDLRLKNCQSAMSWAQILPNSAASLLNLLSLLHCAFPAT